MERVLAKAHSYLEIVAHGLVYVSYLLQRRVIFLQASKGFFYISATVEKQYCVGALVVSAGTARFLVLAFGRKRQVRVYYQAYIILIDAHT